MTRRNKERYLSRFPRIILREIGRLTLVDYDMFATCERLTDGAGLRLASWVERYYEHHASCAQRKALERRHERLYVGPVSGRIVVKPDHADAMARFVSRLITDPLNFDERDVRLTRAIEVADTIMVERGQPTHAERIRMARHAASLENRSVSYVFCGRKKDDS